MHSSRIKELALSGFRSMVESRRYFHMYPETDFDVQETGRYIRSILKSFGLEPRITDCNGVTALVEGVKPGPVIAVRADMDALPVTELSDAPFKSRNDGVMHACGHDAHMAMVLGMAGILSEMKENLRGTVKLIFQPAEETTGGARLMIEEGILDGPDVDAVFALHVTPDLPAGIIGLKEGKMRAAADMFDVTLRGSSSHGAEPEKGIDAIAVAGNIIASLQYLVSRRVSPLESAVLTVGTICGGRARNIIADEVNFSGIIRTLDPDYRELLKSELEKMVSGVSVSMGASSSVRFIEGYPALINDPDMTGLVKRSATEYAGSSCIKNLETPSMGVDDFSYFLQERPGCYFMLGTGFEDRQNFPLHNPRFDIDESVLSLGAGVLAQVCINYGYEKDRI